MCPDHLTHGVTEPAPRVPGPLTEVARILAEHRGIDGLGHEIANHEIGGGRHEVARVGRNTVAEGRRRSGPLRFGCEETREREGAGIEGVLARDLELVPCRQRRVVRQRRRRAVVGDDPQNALVFIAAVAIRRRRLLLVCRGDQFDYSVFQFGVVQALQACSHGGPEGPHYIQSKNAAGDRAPAAVPTSAPETARRQLRRERETEDAHTFQPVFPGNSGNGVTSAPVTVTSSPVRVKSSRADRMRSGSFGC